MKDIISFTSRVKEEITMQNFNSVKLRALLSSFCMINGRLMIQESQTNLVLQTENSKIAKFMYSAFKSRYNIVSRFAYRKSMNFKRKIIYHLIIENKIDEILEDLEMLSYERRTKTFVRSEESLAGFIIGAFLATGSVNNPESSNYHLEISSNDEDVSKYILDVIGRVKTVDFTPKLIKRRNQYVVYLKKSEQIANFLIYISASQACLDFEEIRINRDYYNNDNRVQICVDANMQRTTDASKRQIDEIKIIDKMIGIKNITNEKLKLLMMMRLENEDASMSELSQMMSEKIEKNISKSAINHMFRAIKDLAEKVGK